MHFIFHSPTHKLSLLVTLALQFTDKQEGSAELIAGDKGPWEPFLFFYVINPSLRGVHGFNSGSDVLWCLATYTSAVEITLTI